MSNPQRRVQKPSAAQAAMEGVVFAGEVAPTVLIEQSTERPMADGVSTQAEFDDQRNLQQQEATKAARRLEDQLAKTYMKQQQSGSKLKVALPSMSAEQATGLKPARYRVIGSEGPVAIDGQRVQFRVGKVLDSNQYQIAYLEEQGVKLQKIGD